MPAPVVFVVHDHYPTEIHLPTGIENCGYDVKRFHWGHEFQKFWQSSSSEAQDLIPRAVALFLHKDLGEDAPGLALQADDVAKIIHDEQDPIGQRLRLFVVSGEFSYKGVSQHARENLLADVGYDPTNHRSDYHEHVDCGIYVPIWVENALKFGRVSPEEAATFRGKQMVLGELDVQRRREWLQNHGHLEGQQARGKER